MPEPNTHVPHHTQRENDTTNGGGAFGTIERPICVCGCGVNAGGLLCGTSIESIESMKSIESIESVEPSDYLESIESIQFIELIESIEF